MGRNNKKTKKNDLRIITNSIQKLLKLDEQERKIHKAQKSEIETIQSVMSRYCDDRDVKAKLAKDEEAAMLLQQAKDLITALRILLKQ
jgi:hypothetical protein